MKRGVGTERLGYALGASSLVLVLLGCNLRDRSEFTQGCPAGFADCDPAVVGCETSLAEPANCGACGHDCELGSCEEGRCRSFVLHQHDELGTLLPSEDDLFFTSGGRLLRTSVNGGGQETVVTDVGALGILDLEADDRYVYTFSLAGAHYVGRNLTTGTAVADPGNEPNDIALYAARSDEQLFFSKYVAAGPVSQIRTATLAGTPTYAPSTVKDYGGGFALGIALTSQDTPVWTDVVASNANGANCADEDSQGQLLWANETIEAEQLLGGLSCPLNIVIRDDIAYVVNYGDGRIMSMPVLEGSSSYVLTVGQHPVDLFVDETHVYWVQFEETGDGDTTGSLWRVPRTGGAAEMLEVLDDPVVLRGDATALYWTDGADTIMKMVR